MYENKFIACLVFIVFLKMFMSVIVCGSQGKLVVCLISVLQLMSSSHYQRLCGSMEPKPLKELILRFLLVLHDLIKQQVYPDDWLVMRMSSAQVVLGAVCEISQVIFNHLQPPFDYQVIWVMGVTVIEMISVHGGVTVSLVTSKREDIEFS